MTPKQIKQFNEMRQALIIISKGFATPEHLRKSEKARCGLSYEEALECSYENIQVTASNAVKGVRHIPCPIKGT